MGVNKILHYFGSAVIRLDVLLAERKFMSNGITIKYLFHPYKGSKELIVVFPACYKNKAKYNYIRTLSTIRSNKLFLLDDFGTNHQGCYLVEESVEKCCIELIHYVINRIGHPLRNMYFVGGSKGGYSAIYYGFKIPGVTVIAGAPQYLLGRYLNKENTLPNLEFLLHGKIDESGIRELDFRLKKVIAASSIVPQKIYLHFSDCEPTYEKHVRELLEDLEMLKIPIVKEVMKYESHSEVATYFPLFLLKVLEEELPH